MSSCTPPYFELLGIALPILCGTFADGLARAAAFAAAFISFEMAERRSEALRFAARRRFSFVASDASVAFRFTSARRQGGRGVSWAARWSGGGVGGGAASGGLLSGGGHGGRAHAPSGSTVGRPARHLPCVRACVARLLSRVECM